MFRCEKTEKGVKSFIPMRGIDNIVVRYVQKVCCCNAEEAKEILEVIFINLAAEGGVLRKHMAKEMYQIDVNQYVVKNYRNTKYYRCSKCGRLTPYNVHGKCVQDRCEGTLHEINPDEALATNYYRNQYKTKHIERIVVEEHTAQLKREEAKKFQNDFKDKKINILSCSTTFEMGIDIGDLETVFMRNIPPSPANYVQRSGRAGRRKESSAYILTYCGTNSHDYTYYCAPEKMISGIIDPPHFNVLNQKIIVRHLMAICLGFFFRKHPEYFQTIEGLVFKDGVKRFKEYVSSHPIDLNHYINDKVLPEKIYDEYHDFRWFDKMEGNDEKLENFVNTIQTIAKEYNSAKDDALAEENYVEVNYFMSQLERLHKLGVIDSLSKYCVIPKYGFPIDVVDLQVYDDGKLNNDLDLSRDLKIAISEYAPDSEIIANKKKYTSKYITLPKIGQFPRNYFWTCPECQKVNVNVRDNKEKTCKHCGGVFSDIHSEFYIEPIYGFKTGITKESTHLKPKRSYSGEVSYIGGGIKDNNLLEIGDFISVETSTDDELLVINKSDFYLCPVCGYGEIAKGGVQPPKIKRIHKNHRQYSCPHEELDRIKIGHSFQTDVARLTIPILASYETEGHNKALSFMYALLEGISNALNIERTDIDGVLEMNLIHRSYDVLIYDNVPGGAGHVKRLVDKKAIIEVLQSSYQKVSQNCCDENTSCYNCLRNYYNQSYHGRLKRKYAKSYIETLLNGITGI